MLRSVESAKKAENAVCGADFLGLWGFRGGIKGGVQSFQRLEIYNPVIEKIDCDGLCRQVKVLRDFL